MIDTSNAKWELTKNDTYAIKWLEENGFNVVLKKQYISKTIYTVKKNGIEDRFELPNGFNYDVENYMELYRKTWELLCQLNRKTTL